MHKRTPDPAHARSLVEAAEKEMVYVESLKPTPDAAGTIIRGIYENFRRLGAALLLIQGREGDHEETIDELSKLTISTTRPLRALDNLRRLRHEINYKGYQPTEADLADVLSIKESCWKPVLQEVRRQINAFKATA